jgi:mRNA interferase RelE/StbE
MLEIDFLKPADKFLKKLPPKHRKQVVQKALSLSLDPIPYDSKILKDYPNYRRTDIGEYRIIYRFSNILLTIVIIGKRNDDEVYRKFKRMF